MPKLKTRLANKNTLSQRLAREVDASQAALTDLGPSVAFFGSARIAPDDPYYVAARETARLLSQFGIAVITGGGPGIMQAANEGAKAGRGGRSVGLSIRLPIEEETNPHLDVQLKFDHFASRKVAFCRHSNAFLFFPGGFGTLDELGEVLTLIQCGKSPSAPVLLYDKMFWQGMLDWMQERMLDAGLIGTHDLDRLIFCNKPAEAVAALMHEDGSLRGTEYGGSIFIYVHRRDRSGWHRHAENGWKQHGRRRVRGAAAGCARALDARIVRHRPDRTRPDEELALGLTAPSALPGTEIRRLRPPFLYRDLGMPDRTSPLHRAPT